jgi:hypothetical protein
MRPSARRSSTAYDTDLIVLRMSVAERNKCSGEGEEGRGGGGRGGRPRDSKKDYRDVRNTVFGKFNVHHSSSFLIHKCQRWVIAGVLRRCSAESTLLFVPVRLRYHEHNTHKVTKSVCIVEVMARKEGEGDGPVDWEGVGVQSGGEACTS